MKTASHVDAPMHYLNVGGQQEKPTYSPPPGVPRRNITQAKHKQGITFMQHETTVKNFSDPKEVKGIYSPEVAGLIKKSPVPRRSTSFDHNGRRASLCVRSGNGTREPVKFARNDYTLKPAPQWVRGLLPDEEAEGPLQHRFAVINVWRPLRGPVQDAPLAVCDATGMAQDDFDKTDLKYEDRTGEVSSVSPYPHPRWFYFPQMECAETMLLKCYDSATDGRARFTAHAAFEDPTSPPNALAGESIDAGAGFLST